MGNAAQRTFNAAKHDGDVFVSLAAALAVDNGRTVGALATDVACRVRIVTANLAVSGVAIDHRIHVARRHAEKQVRLAQRFKRVGALPIGLGDDADTKALHFQHPANHRHAKTRMVNIGIAGDDDDVAAVPAQFVHLGAAHRQKFRSAKAGRPVLAVAGQRLGGTREKRNVNRGVHGKALLGLTRDFKGWGGSTHCVLANALKNAFHHADGGSI